MNTLKQINPEDLVEGQEYYVKMKFHMNDEAEILPLHFFYGDTNVACLELEAPTFTIEEAPEVTLEVKEDDSELRIKAQIMAGILANSVYASHLMGNTFEPAQGAVAELINRMYSELITACKKAIKEGER